MLRINKENNIVVKIADFGLSCLHKYKDQKHTKYRGTINFATPEVLDTNICDTISDIYSLGFVLKSIFKIDFNWY